MSSSKVRRVGGLVAWVVFGASSAACDTYVTLTRSVDAGRDARSPSGPFGADGGGREDVGVIEPRDSAVDAPCMPATDGGTSPSFDGTTTIDDGQPPIAGGTLIVTRDGRFAVASDPDQDAVFIVDRSTQSSRAVSLTARDEPGRLVEGAPGVVHVVLRRAGAVVRIDVATGTVLSRDAVCAAPRGIALDPVTHPDTLRLACMDGTLMTLPVAGGAPLAVAHVGDDLRDVVFDPTGAMYVSRFRNASVLRAANADATLVPIELQASDATPRIAWRLAPRADGGFVLLHQLASTVPIMLAGCSAYGQMIPIVQTTVTMSGGTSPPAPLMLPNAPLAVDIALSAHGESMAIAVPGNGFRNGRSDETPDVIRFARNALLGYDAAMSQNVSGQAIAVAYAPDGHLLVQTRAPAAILEDGGLRVALGEPRAAGLGHTIFHTATATNLACASCHAEGNDDGHVWNFVNLGGRRTQTFRGGFLDTAPFHWDGAETDMSALVGDVYVHRMGGIVLNSTQQQALANWIEHLPSLPHIAAEDSAAADRGRALFENPAVGCATCHAGSALTNNATVDVGTGGPLQVPSLRGLRWRAPYMHTGCAATLADRFDPACGGGEAHGHTAGLSDAQRADLIAYLETL